MPVIIQNITTSHSYYVDNDSNFPSTELKLGDIVRELPYIVPPDREPWYGIVVEIDREYYNEGVWPEFRSDMVSVKWLGNGVVEHLPSPVLALVQEAK